MYPILLQWGTFELRTYGVVVVLAFLAALWVGAREAQRRGLNRSLVYDFMPYALLGGIIGARLYYVIFSNPSYRHGRCGTEIGIA
jgi:phosphatidylglycerol:prolipoprotein diacylglycerol transferase